MKRDRIYQRRLRLLEQEIERRSERIAEAWRRILPLLDQYDARWLSLERRERERVLEAELQELRRRLRGDQADS